MRTRVLITAVAAIAALASCSDGNANESSPPTSTTLADLDASVTSAEIAYVSSANGQGQVFLAPAAGGEPKVLASGPGVFEGLAWSPDGSKLAFDSDTGGNFDVWTVGADGTGLVNVTGSNPGSDGYPAWSPDGTRLAFFSDRDGNFDLWVTNADGSDPRNLSNAADPASVTQPAWSPDGTKLAYTVNEGQDSSVWVVGLDGTPPTKLPFPGSANSPTWSAGSDAVVASVSTVQRRAGQLYRIGTDGFDLRRLTRSKGPDENPIFSPDGQFLLFTTSRDAIPDDPEPNVEVYRIDADGKQVLNMSNSPVALERLPSWSSDGKLVAWVQLFQRNDDIVVANADGSGARPVNSGPNADQFPVFRPRR